MGTRRKARELAVQALYQRDLTGDAFPERFVSDFDAGDQEVNAFCLALIHGVSEHGPQIDLLIEQSCQNWRADRISKVDLNVLRVGAYELVGTDVPARIVINEAIEIAKRFGTLDSSTFVNGVLDAIAEKLGRKEERSRGERG
jgi:transcription antitermination protein NusB